MDLNALVQASAFHFTPVNLPPPSSPPVAQSTAAMVEAAKPRVLSNGVTQKVNDLDDGKNTASTSEAGNVHDGTSNDANIDGEDEAMGQTMTAPKRGRGRPRKDASEKPVASLPARSKISLVKEGERRVLRSESSDSIPAAPTTLKRGRGRPPKKQGNGSAAMAHAKVSKDKVNKKTPAKGKKASNGDRRGGHMKDMQNFFSAHRHEVEEHKFKRQQKLLGKMWKESVEKEQHIEA